MVADPINQSQPHHAAVGDEFSSQSNEIITAPKAVMPCFCIRPATYLVTLPSTSADDRPT
jgi:hypothetical protein